MPLKQTLRMFEDMSKDLCIIGYPLAHSLSPIFHQAALDSMSLPIRYHSWPTSPETLSEKVVELREKNYLGASITIPHKENIGKYLDGLTPWAQTIGAVNTIIRDGSNFIGHNTDAHGFIHGLRKVGAFNPKNKQVLLLGAGGAARAAAFGLAKEQISSLIIANRTGERAQSLADDVSEHIPYVSTIELTECHLKKACESINLIVNSTSMGMRHSKTEQLTPLTAQIIQPETLVCDMVYNPMETPLLMEARKAGARILGGLPMLIYQGAAAFKHWIGKEAPIEVMFSSAQNALTNLFPDD